MYVRYSLWVKRLWQTDKRMWLHECLLLPIWKILCFHLKNFSFFVFVLSIFSKFITKDEKKTFSSERPLCRLVTRHYYSILLEFHKPLIDLNLIICFFLFTNEKIGKQFKTFITFSNTAKTKMSNPFADLFVLL